MFTKSTGFSFLDVLGIPDENFSLTLSVQFLPGVNSVVSDEVRLLGERFPTVRAFIGLLAHVGSLVYDEAGVLGESLPAFAALVGFLSSVSPLVKDEV